MIDDIKQHKIQSITDLIQYAIQNKIIHQIKQMQFLLSKAIDENKIIDKKGTKFYNFEKPKIVDNKNKNN